MRKIYLTMLLGWLSVVIAFAQVTIEKNDEGILVLGEGEKVFFYQMEPKSINGQYERRHYIHPLWGIDGNILTEDFPDDHLHHRGVFWAWHQVWIGDRPVGDPWELKDFEQDIVDVEFRSHLDGSGLLKTRVNWFSDKWTNSGHKVPYMEESTAITVHPEKKNYRRIDFEIRLLALEKNLFIGGSDDEKGYSGFSVRSILPPDARFIGPEGEVEPNVTAVKSPGFINVTGSFGADGKKAGIVIMDHPRNPGYPQPWILRNKNSMQNAAFPGNALIPVSTARPLILKYSLLVYSGKLSNSKIKRVRENW